MTTKIATAALMGLCLLLVSCAPPGDTPKDTDKDKKDDATPTAASFVAKTWVVGNDADGDPAIWNNNAATKLEIPSGAGYGTAYCVAFMGDTVYVGGYTQTGSYSHPCVWKDGVREDLEVDGIQAEGMVKAIAVSGSTVYAAGQAWDVANTASVAGYWTFNGTAWTWTALAIVSGVVNAITLNGSGEPLFAGDTTVATKTTACWWNTTPPSNLCFLPDDDATASSVYGIAWYSGTESYLVGYYAIAPDSYPCFWTTGGVRSEQTAPVSPDRMTAVAVSGSDIYMAGWCTISGTTTPGYWKGFQWHACKVDGPGFNYATAMALSDSTVCIAGQYTNSSGDTNGCFWVGADRADVAGILPVYGIAVKN
jgi:hypothetical protein